jgi:transcriptional regulator with XRE-family HTH domain
MRRADDLGQESLPAWQTGCMESRDQHVPADPEARAAEVRSVLNGVGDRLRDLRRERGVTLAELAAATGVSVSTLSRLESGGRKPTLELLLPLALLYQVPLDTLVGAPPVGDPRVRLEATQMNDLTVVPLTRQPGGVRAHKIIIPETRATPSPQVHEGFEWIYVLSGRLRVVLGEHDLVLRSGEAAEFDTHVPHWFGSAGPGPVEALTLFGPQGERVHLRASAK